MDHPPDWLRGAPLAHRGLHGPGRPENSLAAFRAALDHGFGMELDVLASADGEAVVFHDADLARMTGRAGLVAEAKSRDLAGLRLAGTDEPVPLLSQVLELVAGRVPLYVEVKNSGRPGPLEARVLALVSGYRGPLAVASFNPWVLGWFRRYAPGIVRGQIATDFRGNRTVRLARKLLWSRLALNRIGAPHFVSYDLRALPNSWTARSRAAGLPLVAWTVRTEGDLARARLYADNYVFEGFVPAQGGRT